MFKVWWNLIGRRWVPPLYYGTILGVGLFTGIIDVKVIPLIAVISLFFGFGLFLWFLLLEKINS